MKVEMNKDIYLQWIRLSNKCNDMRHIVSNRDTIKVEELAEWKKNYNTIIEDLEKARFDTITHIAKCNEVK